MRVVEEQAALKDAFDSATREASAAFGNGALFAERLFPAPRHIEVQVLGDGSGPNGVTHLYERDCSVQRQHQKLVEVAPCPDIPASLRARLLDAALKLCGACNYRSAGTVEFLVRA